MKAPKLFVLILYLAVSELSTSIALAATKDETSGSIANRQQREEGTRHSDPNIIKVLVEYNSEDGKNVAKQEALQLTYESHRFNLLGMEIESKSLKLLQDNKGIEHVEFDSEVELLRSFEDHDDDRKGESNSNTRYRRHLNKQVPWGIKAIQANQVKPGPLANEVKVCIVDSGYQFHPDLPGRDAVTGSHSTKYSSQAGNRWDKDEFSHGVATAGVIAAIDNEVGVVGVLQNVKRNGFRLHISKGLDDSGRGSVSGVIEAIERCIDAGSDVISMSLRVGRGFVRSFNNILQTAYLKHDILLVAASGNDGNTTLCFPASYPSVMSVAAVKKNANTYAIAKFSNHNNRVEIAAPGVRIRTTSTINEYKIQSGTSIATPYVAGAAALLRSYGRCSAQQVRRILLDTAKDIGPHGCDTKAGHGMVQAKAAVDMLRQHGCGAADSLDLLDANGMNDWSKCTPIQVDGKQAFFINAGTNNENTAYIVDTNTQTSKTAVSISGTSTPQYYQSHRWSSSSLGYNFGGLDSSKTYTVELGFAELYIPNCGAGRRVFDLRINEAVVKSNVDVFAARGCETAYSLSYDTRPTQSGFISIQFIKKRQNPMVSLIRIVEKGGSSPDPAPVATPTQPAPSGARAFFANAGDSRENTSFVFPTTTQVYTFLGDFNISGTSKASYFRSHRYSRMSFGYKMGGFDRNNTYRIDLWFAEQYTPNCGRGKRVFDILVNSKVVKSSLDVFAVKGCETAHRESFNIKPTSTGTFEINFIKKKENPMVSYIEITEVGGSSPPPPPTPPPTRAPVPAPIPVPSLPPFGVSGFVLVNADTNQDIPGGLDCQPACLGSARNFSIRVLAFGQTRISSVSISIKGPVSASRTEGLPPYSAFGDRGGNYLGKSLPPGRYTITAFATDLHGDTSPVNSKLFVVGNLRQR